MTTTIQGFPAYRLEEARGALAKSHARLCRAAAKTGQTAPAAPEIRVLAKRVESRCSACKVTIVGLPTEQSSCSCLGWPSWQARQVVDVEVLAERPRLAGWDFLAVVEPLEGGNLIRQVPGAVVADGELDAWRMGPIACNHCGAIRRRTETFIVRTDGSDAAVAAGTYKQVGRNCLEAFLGGQSPAAILGQLGWPEAVRRAGDDEEGGWGNDRGIEAYAPAVFLAWVAAVVRLDGWLSRTAAREHNDAGGLRLATADVVHKLLGPNLSSESRAERERCQPTDADRVRGAAALDWARALPGDSDYDRNLALVARQETCQSKHLGILASAVPSHTRALGREVERRLRDERASAARAASEYVGTVGERIELQLTIERVIELQGDYGMRNILIMRDAAGNAVLWSTGAATGEPGERLKLRGTVKKHSEYRGGKQTELTRCKILERVSATTEAAAL